jgi:hypothetical protein
LPTEKKDNGHSLETKKIAKCGVWPLIHPGWKRGKATEDYSERNVSEDRQETQGRISVKFLECENGILVREDVAL